MVLRTRNVEYRTSSQELVVYEARPVRENNYQARAFESNHRAFHFGRSCCSGVVLVCKYSTSPHCRHLIDIRAIEMNLSSEKTRSYPVRVCVEDLHRSHRVYFVRSRYTSVLVSSHFGRFSRAFPEVHRRWGLRRKTIVQQTEERESGPTRRVVQSKIFVARTKSVRRW